MIKITKYKKEYKDIWNKFIHNSKNGIFMFDRNFMDYHSDRFKDNSLMFFDENDKLIALLPANIKDNILYSHQGLTYGGFIIDENMKQEKMLTCFESLRKYMCDNGIEQLIYKTIPHIYHKLPSEEDFYALFKNKAKLMKIEPSTTVLLTNPCKMPKGRKAQIARAKKSNITIEKSSDFNEFIRLENEILKKYHNTVAVHTADELALLNSRFPNEIQLWCAKYEGKIIAATLLFVSDNVVHTQYLAADEKARELGALDLLLKYLIDKFQTEKEYFDFGISTENNGSYLNTGLISQKESFGGRTSVYQTYMLKQEGVNEN